MFELVRTSSSGRLTGSIFSRTASITLKMAVLAPMPRASESTATAVNAGLCHSIRLPYFKSCQIVSSRIVTPSFQKRAAVVLVLGRRDLLLCSQEIVWEPIHLQWEFHENTEYISHPE